MLAAGQTPASLAHPPALAACPARSPRPPLPAPPAPPSPPPPLQPRPGPGASGLRKLLMAEADRLLPAALRARTLRLAA